MSGILIVNNHRPTSTHVIGARMSRAAKRGFGLLNQHLLVAAINVKK